MKNQNRLLLTLIFSSLFATQGANAISKGTVEKAMIAAGEQVFIYRCKACHSLDSSKNAFGPTLHGIVNRKSASIPRYAYSSAMKKSGLVWTESNLRKWVANNEKLVPGTRMRHVSITDETEQDFILAFLKSLM